MPAPLHDAELLLADLLAVSRTVLRVRAGEKISAQALARYERRVRRREQREPLQHVLGRWPFLELDLAVDRRALVPRPETEDLVLAARRRLDRGRDSLVADVGTGGGCIALSLARSHPRSRILGIDVSGKALELAAENLRRTGLASRVALVRGDLLAPSFSATFDMIVANLPYVDESELANLEPEVREFDPKIALVAPRAGLGLVRRLVDEAARHLADRGWLLLEAAPRQTGNVAAWLSVPPWTGSFVERDRYGRERIVGARLA